MLSEGAAKRSAKFLRKPAAAAWGAALILGIITHGRTAPDSRVAHARLFIAANFDYSRFLLASRETTSYFDFRYAARISSIIVPRLRNWLRWDAAKPRYSAHDAAR